jgi:asparagine N-glycosylation enzyme membrane subunit Stt3
MSEEEKEPISEEAIIEERKRKIKELLGKVNVIALILLILAVILGVYIRAQPMADHGGHPGLWDITTNTWTLGPDLDPFLFLRTAKVIVDTGSLPSIDTMRNVPLGFDNSIETQLLPYMIVYLYKIITIFGPTSVTYAAVVFPVVMFALTIIVFFLFVREAFLSDDKNKANYIAIISTFFMIVIPVFLGRTVAGIPEKESAAFFFMFLAFYFFLKAWKSEKIRNALILGILSGITTALMGLIWGGVSILFVTVAIAGMVAFILNKVHKKEIIVYSSWIICSFLFIGLLTNKWSLKGMVTSLDTGMASLVFMLFIIHLVIWRTKISQAKFLRESKLPKSLWSVIIGIIAIIVLASVLLGPSFIFDKISAIQQMMFRPVTGRWSTTVAENRQPYFTEWGASFGPTIQNIPILFWLFFFGSALLFKNMTNTLRKKDSWILTLCFVLFFIGLVFSRYAPHPATLDGENFTSKALYYGGMLVLIGGLIYYFLKYHKENNEGFDKIKFEYLFMFALLFLSLFTARSAVRLIMVLGPIAPIFVAYLFINLVYLFKREGDETKKVIFGALGILVIILSVYSFSGYYKQIKSEAFNYVPYYYTQQWQKAMAWVRESTPTDSVFAHWWDYGYWVQSIGDRATVTDGGNAIVWWNYFTGRLVLTGDNQGDALDFLYTHNATHLLIDPTDIGKYGAYSSIGSDKNYDRFSWIPVMQSDAKNTQETKNGIMRVYQGGGGIDEDTTYDNNGTSIFLPGGSAAIIGVTVEKVSKTSSVNVSGNATNITTTITTSINQPTGIFYYEGKQYRIPLRYAYYEGKFYDFGSGLPGAVRIIAKVIQGSNGGIQMDREGGVIYISPRVLNGMMAQIYLLNDPFKKFSAFTLAHAENNIIVNDLNSQGAKIDEFVIYGDIHGPIKIWNIDYTGNETFKPEYLEKNPPKSIDWNF